MNNRNIVVIGASAGGLDALRPLLAGLPENFEAVILIVWHMASGLRPVLPHLLNKVSRLPVKTASDNEIMKNGHVYVAQPDRHLLVEDHRVRLTRGPKENGFRPAVDPLFRSAASTFGQRVIGIVLSGALDDGTAGLWTIKKHGGIAIVQHPDEAEVSSMPESALQAVAVDYQLRAAEIPSVLISLLQEELPHTDVINDERTQVEVKVAMEASNESDHILNEGKISPFTCPECHGVLVAIREGSRSRFRCHTGHAFSANALLAHLMENTEQELWATVRSLQETVMLLNHMGDHFAEANQPKVAAMFFRKAKETEKRAAIIRRTLIDFEELSTDRIQSQVSAD